jgi:hypothetical protein
MTLTYVYAHVCSSILRTLNSAILGIMGYFLFGTLVELSEIIGTLKGDLGGKGWEKSD